MTCRTRSPVCCSHSGAELAEVAEVAFILGHSQIAHTVGLYGHLAPGRMGDAAFDAAVSGGVAAAGTDPAGPSRAAVPAAPGDLSRQAGGGAPFRSASSCRRGIRIRRPIRTQGRLPSRTAANVNPRLIRR